MLFRILGLLVGIILVAEIVFISVVLFNKNKNLGKKMIIYGDAALSLQENILFYNVINVEKNYPKQWEAELDAIILYVAGKEIESVPFKPDNLRGGLRFMLSGMSNSTMDILRLAASVKYDLWEISFDGGLTRIRLYQKQSKNDRKVGRERARENGWDQDKTDKISAKTAIKQRKKDSLLKGSMPKHGLLSHINETKSSATRVRYQVMVPRTNPLWERLTGAIQDVSFYHVYEGYLYRIDSEYIGNLGNMHEFDLINLESSKAYVGISTSIDGGKTIFPSSTLYAITKDHKGLVPTLDEAELAKPKNKDVPKYDLWSEGQAINYIGEKLAKRMYDIIVKKHYEDEYTDEFLSLSRSQEFYSDYLWLKGHEDKSKEDELHVQRHVDRVTKEHSNSAIANRIDEGDQF